MDRQSPNDAAARLQNCLELGEIIPGKHFRDELKNENLILADAHHVMRTGSIFNQPECDIKTGEWKYTIEGWEPDGKWIAIVFCFKSPTRVYLITVWSKPDISRRG